MTRPKAMSGIKSLLRRQRGRIESVEGAISSPLQSSHLIQRWAESANRDSSRAGASIAQRPYSAGLSGTTTPHRTCGRSFLESTSQGHSLSDASTAALRSHP
jgi:hypothetical protein